ncbi:LacI family DNA-binding transcriptional regulator [Mucisphaera sp.]|uniref:LacI family DNA-binding transcriptional regulator n=1 Tax=Mucisphaera sp. TaxID=2913024 RepID=UPI003D0D2539
MVKLADVARHAGVSKTQVSFVLNQKNLHLVSAERRARISKAIRDLDYHPNLAARRLAGKSTRLIGLLTSGQTLADDAPLLQAALTATRLRGYQAVVTAVPGSPDARGNVLSQLEAYDLDGVIDLMPISNLADPADRPALGQFRQVVTVGHPTALGVAILPDHQEATRLAVHHLAERGKRRIGLLQNQIPNQQVEAQLSNTNVERQRGVEIASEQLGWVHTEGLTFNLDRQHDYPTSSAVHAVIQRLVVEARCDAILAPDDRWAVRLIAELRRDGDAIPEDIAIVGYGNLPMSELGHPALTTIDPQQRRQGLIAVDRLITDIETQATPSTKDSAPEIIRVEPRLVVRESS